MKGVLASLIVFLSFLSFAKGQDFMIRKDSVTTLGMKGDIIAPKTFIINNSDSTIEFRWVRAASNRPQKWKNPGVCDKNLCYDDQDSATFSLASKDSGQLKINFYAYDENFNGVSGNGYLNLVLYPVDKGRAESKSVFFKGSTLTTGIENKAAEQQLFSHFPNPAGDYINISFKNDGTHRVNLISAVGETLKSMEYDKQSGRMSLDQIPAGVYYLEYQNGSERSVTKKLIKR